MSEEFNGIFPGQIRHTYQKQFYKNQIDLFAKDKVVVDLGAGNGILSFLSVLAGAKKVFAIEKNKIVCMMLQRSVDNLGWQDKITVVNRDFIHNDISDLLESSDVLVSEIINNSITTNIFPKVIRDIKEKYKHLKIIPDRFCIQANVVVNPFLDQRIDWGYAPMLNNIFDKIYLEYTAYQPMKLLEYNFDEHQILQETQATIYNFDSNSVDINPILLPKNRQRCWLEIIWHFDKEVFSNYWQREYVPLWTKWFENTDSITISPNDYTHKLKKM